MSAHEPSHCTDPFEHPSFAHAEPKPGGSGHVVPSHSMKLGHECRDAQGVPTFDGSVAEQPPSQPMTPVEQPCADEHVAPVPRHVSVGGGVVSLDVPVSMGFVSIGAGVSEWTSEDEPSRPSTCDEPSSIGNNPSPLATASGSPF